MPRASLVLGSVGPLLTSELLPPFSRDQSALKAGIWGACFHDNCNESSSESKIEGVGAADWRMQEHGAGLAWV